MYKKVTLFAKFRNFAFFLVIQPLENKKNKKNRLISLIRLTCLISPCYSVFVAGAIRNQKSQIKNGKRPYKKTPARQAAYLANLKKAQAVPKEKRYQPSEYR